MRCLMTAAMALLPAVCCAEDKIRHYFETLNSGYSLPVHGEQLLSTDELQQFYERYRYQPVWYRDGSLTKAGTELYLSVETATADGLDPEDYHNKALQEKCPAEGTAWIAYCDLLFSDAFFLLAQHLLAGKVNPDTLSPGWDVGDKREGLVPLLENALAEGNIKNTLADLRPAQVRYERLMAVLQRLRAARYPEWPAVEESPPIQPEQEDARLATIVERLVFWGDMPAPSTPVDSYNQEVQEAIKYFQGRHGLRADGVISSATLAALNVSPSERTRQVQTNMERLRWLAEDLGGQHLLVNIAGFELEAVKHNETAFTTPIAVSSYCSRIPVFSDEMRYVVFNPVWTVARMALEDQLAAIRRDPDYLQQLNFTVYAGITPVDPDAVDWSRMSRNTFEYRLVQAPGPRNALGQVKFIFPNAHDVYLHDAPGDDLFDEAETAFNAGCIRVQQPLDLAAWLLKGGNWSRDQMAAQLEKGIPEAAYLNESIAVHVEYRTAWVTSRGVLNFRPDVFERDELLYGALVQPLTP